MKGRTKGRTLAARKSWRTRKAMQVARKLYEPDRTTRETDTTFPVEPEPRGIIPRANEEGQK